MSVECKMNEKLTSALSPQTLHIENESHRHAGHREMRDQRPQQPGETHFRVYIVAEAFSGKSRLERHRMINTILAEELSGPIHALAITALTPEEAANR